MCKFSQEAEAAVGFLRWLREQLAACGRAEQLVLFVGDGHYDHLNLWKALPEGVTLLARSAKNRVLYHLLSASPRQHGRKRLYGKWAATPQ